MKKMLPIGWLFGYEGLTFLMRMLPSQRMRPLLHYTVMMYLEEILRAFVVLAARFDGQ
jgi:hypothetical protein